MCTTLYYFETLGISSRLVLGVCSPGYEQVIPLAKLKRKKKTGEREKLRNQEGMCLLCELSFQARMSIKRI